MNEDTLFTLIAILFVSFFVYGFIVSIFRSEGYYKSYKNGTYNPYRKEERELPTINELFKIISNRFDSISSNLGNNIYCEHCGNRISRSASFCSNCGKEINKIHDNVNHDWMDEEKKGWGEDSDDKLRRIITKRIGDYKIEDLNRMSYQTIYKIIKNELQKITTSKRKPTSGEVEYLKDLLKKIRKDKN